MEGHSTASYPTAMANLDLSQLLDESAIPPTSSGDKSESREEVPEVLDGTAKGTRQVEDGVNFDLDLLNELPCVEEMELEAFEKELLGSGEETVSTLDQGQIRNELEIKQVNPDIARLCEELDDILTLLKKHTNLSSELPPRGTLPFFEVFKARERLNGMETLKRAIKKLNLGCTPLELGLLSKDELRAKAAQLKINHKKCANVKKRVLANYRSIMARERKRYEYDPKMRYHF